MYIYKNTSYISWKKERLCKEARERYQNLFVEEKEKSQKKTQGTYKILSEEEKEKKRQKIVIKISAFLKKENKKSWAYGKLLLNTNHFIEFYKVFWK